MANFQSDQKNLGVVNRGQTYQVAFKKTPECKPVSHVSTGCGCTTAGDIHRESIVLTWTVSMGEDARTVKNATVTFMDGSQDLLSFSAETR